MHQYNQPVFITYYYFLFLVSVNNKRLRRSTKGMEEERVLLRFSNEEIVWLTTPEDGKAPTPGQQTVVKNAVLDIAVSVCHRRGGGGGGNTEEVMNT